MNKVRPQYLTVKERAEGIAVNDGLIPPDVYKEQGYDPYCVNKKCGCYKTIPKEVYQKVVEMRHHEYTIDGGCIYENDVELQETTKEGRWRCGYCDKKLAWRKEGFKFEVGEDKMINSLDMLLELLSKSSINCYTINDDGIKSRKTIKLTDKPRNANFSIRVWDLYTNTNRYYHDEDFEDSLIFEAMERGALFLD